MTTTIYRRNKRLEKKKLETLRWNLFEIEREIGKKQEEITEKIDAGCEVDGVLFELFELLNDRDKAKILFLEEKMAASQRVLDSCQGPSEFLRAFAENEVMDAAEEVRSVKETMEERRANQGYGVLSLKSRLKDWLLFLFDAYISINYGEPTDAMKEDYEKMLESALEKRKELAEVSLAVLKASNFEGDKLMTLVAQDNIAAEEKILELLGKN